MLDQMTLESFIDDALDSEKFDYARSLLRESGMMETELGRRLLEQIREAENSSHR